MRAVSYFFICVFFFSISCRKENSPTTSTTSSKQHHEKFASYIAAFTSGVISKTASIKIRLRVPLPETSSITEELFEFKPSIKGSTYWQDNQTIVFQPNQPIPSGEEFKASFYLRKVLKEVEENEPFEFTFKTYPQLITVNLDGLESYDSKNLQWQKVFGNVSLVDMENTEDLKSVFKAVQNGLPLPVKWLQSERSTLHRFYIDSVRRTEQEGSVLLSWDGEKIGSKEKGEKTFTIPALGDFRVLEVEVFQNPSQHISVLFSDPLDNNQNLNGLVRLSNGAAIRYNISQNQLKIYPTQRQTGKTQLMLSSIKNSLGYKIPDELTYTVVFQDIKPAVRFVGNGNIMPSTKGLILPFEAVNLSAVKIIIVKIYEKNIPQFLQINQLDGMSELGRVGSIVFKGEVKLTASKPIDYGTWNAFSIDLSNYISAEPGAIYRVMFSFDKKHSLYPCTGDDANLSEEQTSLLSERDNWQDENNAYTSYDFEDESYYYYDYYDREYNPCENEYYKQYRRKVFKNILATDLGVIVKGSSMGEYTVAVTDLKTTSYVSNAKIEMLDYQLQPIASGITDSEGIAKISMSKKPYLLVATKEKQKGYLRLDDASSLSLSAFDVDGQKTKKGVKGFIYGERGVWRPGDSLHLSFILEDKENVLPDDHPVIFELYDPLNNLVTKKVSNKHIGGIYYFGTSLDENALTGNWNAYVTVGASTFTKQIRVETIKPNRLKIDFQVEETITSDVTEARLKASWLNGASAKELRANVRMTLSPTKTTFKGYENYYFDNPTISFEEKAHDVYDSQLNDEGEALVNIHMPKIHGAGGMLKAVFTTRVFEKSGDFSTDQVAVNYSPYPSYVGIQAPKTESWEGLDASKTHTFKVVTVDPYGKPLSRNLKVKVYRLKWRWWWEANEDEYLADYVGNESVYLVKEFEVQTGTNGEGTFNLKIDEVDDYSRYLVMVNDRSGHATGEKVFFSPAGGEEKVATGATMLVFSTDKPKYAVGDKIKVSVPSGGVGKIFVTLEKGSKILKSFWTEASEKSTTIELPATPELAPNFYLGIHLIQPHNVAVNDAPIRMYGVKSISVEDPASLLNPVIEMPNELAPEKKFTLKVKEKNGKKMSYTIAIVDEGLLDLTNFKTPNPWHSFYAKEALGVRTWDYYDKVMGAYAGEIAALLQIGGDNFLNDQARQKIKRFKPVVKFLGPFLLEKDKTQSHEITLPNYVGSVRTMVVAGYDGAYGCAEKTTPVKKPLMVVATMPRVLSPDEVIALPVNVFAMDKRIQKVEVTIQPNELLIPIGETKKEITFSTPGDEVVLFDLRVASMTGHGKVKVTVRSGNEESYHEIDIAVRNPNPMVTESKDGIVEGGSTWSESYQTIGIEGTNNAVLEVSAIPPINLEKRLQYLIQYPHGCVEQVTSAAFPQLYVHQLIELTPDEKSKIEQNVKTALQKLRNFQTSKGGMAYWSGENQVSEWGTNYAGHFLLEAQKAGYTLPDGMMANWLRYQKQQSSSWKRNYPYDEQIQAYRLYTLALAGEADLAAMNRLRELPKVGHAAKWVLASAYQMAGQPEAAKQLIRGLPLDIPPYKEYTYTYGSDLRDEAMILEALSLLNLREEAMPLLKQISAALNSKTWYSTQTTAYCLLAIRQFIGFGKDVHRINFDVVINDKKQTITTERPIAKITLPVVRKNNTVSVTNRTGGTTIFAKIFTSGIPLMGDIQESESNLKMSLRYLNNEGIPISPDIAVQGQDLVVEVKVTNPSRVDYHNLALTQIFPSGWEIQSSNVRFHDGYAHEDGNSPFDYQDIRDDRVNTYFSLLKNETKTFRVRVNAAYVGSYYMPVAYCEAMYDHEVSARKGGGKVNVIRSGS